MKSIALLALSAALASATAAYASDTAPAKQLSAAEPKKEATVYFEIIKHDSKNSTLLTSGGITVDVEDAAIITPVSSEDFGKKDFTQKGAFSLTRDTTYISNFERRTDILEDGTTREIDLIIPGTATEGTRGTVRLAQLDGEPLAGTLTLHIRSIDQIKKFQHNGYRVDLPEYSQQTFSVALKEGENVHRVGNFTINAAVDIKKGAEPAFKNTKVDQVQTEIVAKRKALEKSGLK